MLIPILIFVATYAFVAIGEIPGLRIDRAGAALIGAGLMIAFGIVSLPEAYRAVDFDTILLLFSMMILVAYLRLSGFFQLVSKWVAEYARRQDPKYRAPIASHGEYNRYIRDYFSDERNKGKSLRDAVASWNAAKRGRGDRRYRKQEK